MNASSNHLIRTFIAVPVPQMIRVPLESIRNTLKTRITGARWVRGGNIHLTIRFLGSIEPSTADRIGNSLDEWVRSIPGHSLTPSVLGIFPTPRRPKVLWVGFRQVPEHHKSLVKTIEQNLSRLGFPRERRAYTPHLTLARFRKPIRNRDLDFINRFSIQIPEFPVTEIRLYRSELRQTGARYTPLFTVPLGGAEGG